ncbi:TorF family putative porin [Altererythrobacter aquiaggeris]|uniref:TorF family putative porin n=1 Tax=Aestuarierythrobacter aquiaggeris TaxID=1898396 RepID=UPI003016F2F5
MLTSTRSFSAASAFSLASAFAVLATPALAQDTDIPSDIEVSGNVAVVTDYRFRGVSLSAGDPAVQGGIDVVHSSGFYVGTWGSSIDGGPLYGELELDLYGGWSGDVAEGVTLDVGVLYYAYPANDFGPAEYYEPYASIATQFGPLAAKLGVAYAPDQQSLGDQDNLYVYTDFEVGLPTTPITLSAHVGYTDGVLAPDLLGGGTDDSGFDYSIGASATVLGGLGIGVQYIATDGVSVNGLTDDAVVGTLSFSF